MKFNTSTVFDILLQLRAYFKSNNTLRNNSNEEPFRSELYSSDQMDRHGKILAGAHRLQKGKSADQLLKRLDDNEETLLEVRNLLVENIRLRKPITPGAEWLLDNFYLIEEQIVIARKHLPKGYSEGLPSLANGVSLGMPRVYDIVLEIISHSDGRVDSKGLSSFIASYQNISILTLGELWAIPIMLRLAVIENLRRVSGKIALDMIDHNLAEFWADKMMATVQEAPGNLILTIADMARSKPTLESSFVAGFTRELQGKGPTLALPLNWLEQQLTGIGNNINNLVRQENQKQAADQVSVSNSIGTLRFLGATDWRVFVESLSSVENILRQDSTGTYPNMDFATRDRYRHVVESISKGSSLSETEVAKKAIELASIHKKNKQNSLRQEHVGYYLIDKGLNQAEKVSGMRYTLKQKLTRITKKFPVFLYLSSISIVSLLLATGVSYFTYIYGTLTPLLLVCTTALILAGSTQLAISFVNWLSTLWVMPILLPRMDFSKGIPAEYRTLVIVPTLLINKSNIEELVEALEIRFLANREQNLHFGLLTDFTDSNTAHVKNDDALLKFVCDKIEALNDKYSNTEESIFFLFHRPRTWNPIEKKWMGYERKRGKLSALNAFIQENKTDAFSTIIGNTKTTTKIKYVITLDSDTKLPRDAAWKFIATMAHPLNHAHYNEQEKRVTEGYGILQPRVVSGIPSTATTLYLRMQGNASGIDPYTKVSSDVYQDLFEEGSFIGKGIYDVELFEKAVRGVLQENRILSHDLLEGCYSRSGLISDVFLYEDGVAQYETDIKRHHRWVRGDWQIGAWMLPFITNGNGRLTKNKLSALSRWKIFDNIRRSFVPLSFLSLLILGWTILPFAWFWTLAVTFIILLTVMASAGWQLLNKPVDITLKAHLKEVGVSVKDILIRFTFGIAVLPYEAFIFADAIIRTNWRMIFSHKKLLEWTASSSAGSNRQHNILSSFKSMWVTPFIGLSCATFFLIVKPETLIVAWPMLVLWLIAPILSWKISKAEKEASPQLNDEQLQFLHKSARKTWLYFEQFVNEKENWLPPDNYQEQPLALIAHRTSPTNMGLALLANLTAYDFGYITCSEFIRRSEATLNTMNSLERYIGHFYNWYDTETLRPLHPRYVSTVDSGNLIGKLLTLRQGLFMAIDQPLFTVKLYEGLLTTTRIILDYSNGIDIEKTKKILNVLKAAVANSDQSLINTKKGLITLQLFITEFINAQTNKETEIYKWIEKLSSQVNEAYSELVQLSPWVELLPVPIRFANLSILNQIPSLKNIKEFPALLIPIIQQYHQHDYSVEEKEWLTKLEASLIMSNNYATEKITQIEKLSELCEKLSNVEYDFLFNKSTNLLRIGYNVDEQRKDESYYDLLASEARLGIFVAIAQGKLPQESWFALGRLLTNSGGDPILLSWSGSMFEYLMPQLIMPTFENTLLHQTNKATVKRQIEYAGQRGIPWGMSESGYNMVDGSFNYQYRAFGVPGLGLKRGLEEDLVVAPYASMLALMIAPIKACVNLQLLAKEGFEGKYGFFEAIDYTTSRLPRGKNYSIVNSYMVHHQGMGFLSLAYVLLNKPMQQRFSAELRFQATLLLLQEKMPRATLFYAHTADLLESRSTTTDTQVRRIGITNARMPEVQLLSNGRYQVMVTNSGGGYSRWKDISVTRWREDATKDNHGIFCYIKDLNSGHFWSNTYQPTLRASKRYEAIFSQGHVEFHRHDYGIDTHTEVVISPEDDIEMRRIRLTNKTSNLRFLEITSYAEIVMASHASDEAHPAFSNLFVQTEIIPQYNAIFGSRRPRSENELPPWMFHLMSVHGAIIEKVSYETDRMKFIGRGKTLAHPNAMDEEVLSGNQGSVLDPIMAIRYKISLKPNQTATIDLIYGISETKESSTGLMHKYRDQHLKKRALELSWTHSQVLLRQLNATEIDTQLYDRLASSILFVNPELRAEASVIQNNFRSQSGLWSHSISGDIPIVLLHIYDTENIELVKQMIQAHAYWRLKGLSVDLVIWNEDYGSYRQLLQEQILGLIPAESNISTHAKPRNIFVKSADQLSSEDRMLFESVARIIIHDNKGTLSEQVNRYTAEKILPPLLEIKNNTYSEILSHINLPSDLLLFNGTGGFTADGNEYKILLDKNKTTPAPWVNVLANPNFGTVVSESGSAYTWAINAHEYRITPWANDPISDVGGEALYLRDEETGNFWSPTSFPAKGKSPYIITHGFGYSTFEHIEDGIHSEMSVFVDKEHPVKFIILKIKNDSGRERKLSATGYLEIILGDVRSKTNMHILSEHDANTGTLLFRNRYNAAFSERVTYFRAIGNNQSFTADRLEFIGRNKNLQHPQALSRKKLSNKTGAGIDPCAALQVKFELLDGAEKEIIFQIGNEENIHATHKLISKFSTSESVKASLVQVKEYWKEAISAVQIETPNQSLNILANGWLTYQTMACRIFARSGFYQSGGAFGFRDQLQDVLALLHNKPQLAKEQILLSASRQFVEGDVQHWWHPPEGRGVRTRCSDDMLWLPFVTSNYVMTTGDSEILNSPIGFLESRPLNHEEDSLYDLPNISSIHATLYEHCVRAIKHSLHFGEHGLPFIGSGDWNDGMDLVGNKGKGESVWLAFFLYDILIRFSKIAESHKDIVFSESCRKDAETLQANIEAHAWDGQWYKRAYFDDGTPLGSKDNSECRIDAIAQSWSVLSGAANNDRKKIAMASLDKHLVRRDLKLIQLLDPPFDGFGLSPGYIKGYVPGVRENGGQYSHAAIWALMAFAAAGDREKVWELFNIVNPLNHALTEEDVKIYKVEPYVMAADVYANESHKGRGGWTWYTGSSGWMYQFIIGSLLGMKLEKDQLLFNPCFPIEWSSVNISYRYGNSTHKIKVFQLTEGEKSYWKIGAEEGQGNSIQLIDDGGDRIVEVYCRVE